MGKVILRYHSVRHVIWQGRLNISVSIIIPAFNAEKTLTKCLESVYISVSAEDEVIVVNDASTDLTLQIAHKFKCSVINVPQNIGAAHARNLGAEASKNSIILFLDSDVLMTKETIEKIKDYFTQNQQVHSITMNVTTSKTANNFYSDFKNLYMNFIISESEESVNYIYGSCCATRKRGFVNWPENIRLTEDSLWGYQQRILGLEIHCLKNIEVTHLKTYSFRSLVKNDFAISSYFSRMFFEFDRWKTIYSAETFGHTSKSQKISIILSLFPILGLIIGPWGSLFFFGIWFLLNFKFVKFLSTHRGLFFAFKSIAWYYFVNLIYFGGICNGALYHLLQKNDVAVRKVA